MNWRLAALLLCVVAGARAQDAVYRYYLPHAGPATRIEWASPGAGWEVTVNFDSARCEIYCSYRRVRDSFGPTARLHFFQPPAATVLVYRDSASKPEKIVVDPASTRLPRLTAPIRYAADLTSLPGRELAAILRPPAGRSQPEAPHRDRSIPATTLESAPASVPLRI